MSSIEQYNYKEVYDDSLVTATVTNGFIVDNNHPPVTKVHLDIKANPDSTSTGPIELKRLDDKIKDKQSWIWDEVEGKNFRKKNDDTEDTAMNHLGEKTPITVTTPEEEKELHWMAETIRKVMNDGKNKDIEPPVEIKRKTDHLEDTIAKLHHQIRHLEDSLTLWKIGTLVMSCVILGYISIGIYINYFMK